MIFDVNIPFKKNILSSHISIYLSKLSIYIHNINHQNRPKLINNNNN